MAHRSGYKYWGSHAGVGDGACVGVLEQDVSSCANAAKLRDYVVGSLDGVLMSRLTKDVASDMSCAVPLVNTSNCSWR